MATITMHDDYAQEPGGLRLRGAVAAAVVLAHVAAIAYLFVPAPAPKTVGSEAMEVVFIAPSQQEPLPPPLPQPKVEQPPLLTAQRTAEPLPDAPVIPPEPVIEAPADAPVKEMAPPAPPVESAAPPSSPVAPGSDSGIVLVSMPRRPPLILPSGVKSVTVRVLVKVDARGRVKNVSLATTSGYPVVDDRALRDARDSRYKPMMKNDVAVEGQAVLPIKYVEQK